MFTPSSFSTIVQYTMDTVPPKIMQTQQANLCRETPQVWINTPDFSETKAETFHSQGQLFINSPRMAKVCIPFSTNLSKLQFKPKESSTEYSKLNTNWKIGASLQQLIVNLEENYKFLLTWHNAIFHKLQADTHSHIPGPQEAHKNSATNS